MKRSNKFNTGDSVFVVRWGHRYSSIGGGRNVFEWKTEIPDYSSIDFHYEIIREPLNRSGKPWKRPYDAPVKERIARWKNYKWEIVEWRNHPEEGKDIIYLLRSIDRPEHPCFVEMGEDGISLLTPEQFKDAAFNALVEAHRRKYSVDDRNTSKMKDFPQELFGKIYDINDNVLFGSSYIKGKVYYEYVPKEYTVDDVPFINTVGIHYDGIGNADLPADAVKVAWSELKTLFPNNQFNG